ncbi:response regulator [Bacteroides sp. AM16-24]|nr:response regulator [Bacteroides sp. AM16-24]
MLVAEDIQSNFLLVSALLKKHFHLVNAKNGQEAVEAVKNKHFDLVLMDMKMPMMDGLAATAEIRKFDTEVPIIALTAHAFDTDQQAALEAGCNEYLVKPFNKARLMEVVKKYCDKQKAV